MMHGSIASRAELFEHAASGATILTATSRLARALQLEYAALQGSRNVVAWETPDILPIHGWLTRCCTDSAALRGGGTSIPGGMLDTVQEEILWEEAVRMEAGEVTSISIDALARLMMRAHDVEKQWLLSIDNDDAITDDAALYTRVRDRVREKCRESGHLPPSMLWDVCDQLLHGNIPRSPQVMILVGFERSHPLAMRRLLTQLARGGTRLLRFEAPTQLVTSRAMRFATRGDEVLAAAAWARRLLETGEDGIAVVFPRLQESRPLIERIFTQTLLPASAGLRNTSSAAVFELSLGVRLAQEPIVNAALHALDLLAPMADTDAISRVLRSGYFCGSEIWASSRACVDADLRRDNLNEDGWPSFSRRLGASKASDANDPLQRFLAAHGFSSERKLPSAWADYFDDLLADIGWPGDAARDSRAHQARIRFHEQLNAMAGFDALLGSMTAPEAVGRLRRLTSGTVFQPRSRNAPIQIMGAFEAIGQNFRHVRLCDMTEDSWPPPVRPAAFIPIAVQKRAGVSDAVTEIHAADMERVTSALLACAPDVVVTSANMDGDRELLPSPLVASLPLCDADDLAMLPAEWLRAAAPVVLERFTDESAPPLPIASAVRGGAGLFTMQARCPFQAFARLRLRAEPLAMPAHGVRPLDRGDLVHGCLKRVWDVLLSSQGLLRSDLPEVIARAVEEEFAHSRLLKYGRLSAQMISAERECIRQVLAECLAVETARPPFTIAATEAAHTAEIAGLTVSLKIDRIDRLADGSLAMIDYKIGSKSASDWMSERPLEPQLPLYAVSWPEAVSSLSFATVKRAACGFAGLTEVASAFPQLRPVEELADESGQPLNWSALLEQWRDVLGALAASFRDGDARVDPRDGIPSCAYCDVQPLCRIDEYAAQRALLVEDEHD